MAVKRVEGVSQAEFFYDRAEGFVTYDENVTSPEEFIAELERLTDFSATVRDSQEHGDGEDKDSGHRDQATEEDGHR